MNAHPHKDSLFIHFNESTDEISLPLKFNDPFDYKPHSLCILASNQLQNYIVEQTEWSHNFGLDPEMEGREIGKMFGVLVVKTADNELGFLCAFSGKLAGTNHHSYFVPPIFDSAEEGGFLNLGFIELSRINTEIKRLSKVDSKQNKIEVTKLKTLRKNNSIALQNQLFDNYQFINQQEEVKTLRDVFINVHNKIPPSAAGECAAPKLLQYAFEQHMKPLALAEFWWGKSNKSEVMQHGQFYPSCNDKCRPILKHMLEGIPLGQK